MYRKTKFLTILHAIREEMSREADYDVELFAELARNEGGSRGALPEDSPKDLDERKNALQALQSDVKQSYRDLPDDL